MSFAKHPIFVLLAALAFPCCTRHFVRQPVVHAVDEIPASVTKEVALVGFYSYRTKLTDVEWRGIRKVNEYEASLDFTDRFKKLLPYARSVEDYEVVGVDETMPAYNINRFILSYMEEIGSHVGKHGVVELSKLIEYVGNTPRFKRRGVDYYVVGVLLPVFARSSSLCLSRLTCVAGVFTLGLAPFYDTHPVESRFIVFDRDLNLLKTFEYEGEYSTLTAWWLAANLGEDHGRSPPPEAWQAQIVDFSFEFSRWLENPAPANVLPKIK